jgi:stress-induced-phosphoprotein 1
VGRAVCFACVRAECVGRRAQFPEAVFAYTEAMRRNPTDHKLYSNRAACYMKLGAFNEAKSDAEKCIAMDPTFAKGYTRKGAVQFFMKEYDRAIKTYEEGLKHDPENDELKEGIKRCVDMINKGNRGELSEDEMKARQESAMTNPEIQDILQDPVMRQVLADMQVRLHRERVRVREEGGRCTQQAVCERGELLCGTWHPKAKQGRASEHPAGRCSTLRGAQASS